MHHTYMRHEPMHVGKASIKTPARGERGGGGERRRRGALGPHHVACGIVPCVICIFICNMYKHMHNNI